MSHNGHNWGGWLMFKSLQGLVGDVGDVGDSSQLPCLLGDVGAYIGLSRVT